MAYSEDRLDKIFSKTGGRCHLCHGGLWFEDYAARSSEGGWEVEHSHPKALGGSDHLNNLFPACVPCNRSKGTRSARAFRRDRGLVGPPPREPDVTLGDVVISGVLLVGSVLVLRELLAVPSRPGPSRVSPRQRAVPRTPVRRASIAPSPLIQRPTAVPAQSVLPPVIDHRTVGLL